MRGMSNLAIQKITINGAFKLQMFCTRDLNPARTVTFRKLMYNFFNSRIAQGELLKGVNYSEDSTP
jgi:hypothetical protein